MSLSSDVPNISYHSWKDAMFPGDYRVIFDVKSSKLKMFSHKGILAWTAGVIKDTIYATSIPVADWGTCHLHASEVGEAIFTKHIEGFDEVGNIWFAPMGVDLEIPKENAVFHLPPNEFHFLKTVTVNTWNHGGKILMSVVI